MTFTPESLKLAILLERKAKNITSERAKSLSHLAKIIQKEIIEFGTSNISFICTHNSRRSQIAELTLRLASDFYKIRGMNTFSAGTEATALNHRVIHAFENLGFSVATLKNDQNPVYSITYSSSKTEEQEMFSKTYDDAFNPSGRFTAVMVCSDAEENCPFIPNAATRLKLTFEDPKHSDDTADEQLVYQNKVMEIGSEMFYIAHLLAV